MTRITTSPDWLKLAGPELPRFRHWADETVVYDTNAGHTHLLTHEAGVLLEALSLQPQPRSSLYAAVAEALHVAPDTAAEFVDDTVEALQKIGIVDTCQLTE